MFADDERGRAYSRTRDVQNRKERGNRRVRWREEGLLVPRVASHCTPEGAKKDDPERVDNSRFVQGHKLTLRSKPSGEVETPDEVPERPQLRIARESLVQICQTRVTEGDETFTLPRPCLPTALQLVARWYANT